MVNQVFTFGVGHIFGNYYVEIFAGTKERCRELMFSTFGTKWSIQYDSVEEIYPGTGELMTITELPNGKIVTTVKELRIEKR